MMVRFTVLFNATFAGEGMHTTTVFGKRYNVFTLWEFARQLPVETVSVSLFDKYREETDCWGNLGPKNLLGLVSLYGVHYNTMVLAQPSWASHIRRVQYCSNEYPLLVLGEDDVLDGMHRLTRAWIDGIQEIKIQRFLRMPKSAIVR